MFVEHFNVLLYITDLLDFNKSDNLTKKPNLCTKTNNYSKWSVKFHWLII